LPRSQFLIPSNSGRAVLIFVGAILWGLLSGQFFMQAVTSLLSAIIYAAGFVASQVEKSLNAMGVAVALVQAAIFGALLFGGNWLSSQYIDYGSWNAVSITALVSCLFSLVYCAVQVPGKLLSARMMAWQLHFAEARIAVRRAARIAHAKKVRSQEKAPTS
jgi:MFS family permease